ncbi:hypothetical protein COO60DRAFT_1457574 [Scenedesmus sp. NREL 46B-D3]|nr:hypothetical protein COO60DRAFT_1457574 [Scenedesmus sp. NREL 46B-D3]
MHCCAGTAASSLQLTAAGTCVHAPTAFEEEVVHRVGVFDAADEDGSDDDGSDDGAMACEPDALQGISISAIVSQSDVAAYLHKHADQLGPLADATVAQLGLAGKAVVCVPGEMSAIHAFASMAANKVSCVGVVSHAHGGGLVGSLSSSDLAGLLPEHFVSLAGPVLQYLTARASASWGGQPQHAAAAGPALPAPRVSLQQQQQPAGGGARAWGLKGGEGLKLPPLVSCSPASSLRQVLALLAAHRLHRLHVLDGHSRPVGIVTITDLLRLIVGPGELLEAYGPEVDVEEEVEVLGPHEPPDCSMGVDAGQELIDLGEPRRGLLQLLQAASGWAQLDEYKDNPLYAKEAANAAAKGASQGAEAVKDALVDTGDRLKEAAGEAGDAIRHSAKSTGENVKEGVDQAQGPRADSGVHVPITTASRMKSTSQCWSIIDVSPFDCACGPHVCADTWESTQDAVKGTAKDIKKGVEGAGDRIGGN